MSLLEILLAPHPCLKRVAKPVEEIDSTHQALIKDMFETMYAAPGIGLAAPQVGIEQRIIVVDVGGEEEPDPRALINPEITWRSDETGAAEEGCLSLPRQFADVKRPKSVTVSYRDQEGATHSIEAHDLLARCLQHEIDHLNGTLFVDHLSALKRGIIMRKLAKTLRKKPA